MDPFIGEIKLFCGNFAPVGWLMCDGSLQSIGNYPELFNVIGTTYGGDGSSTFGLPDLRGRVPVHSGPGFALGQAAGAETETLSNNEMASHAHNVRASSQMANVSTPSGSLLGQTPSGDFSVVWISPSGQQAIPMAMMIDWTGAGNPHDNCQPFQCVNFIIATSGIYPSGT